LKTRRATYQWVKSSVAYNDYVRWVITYDNMLPVVAGELIGYIGNSGYSTGHHTHLQIHANRGYNSRIDPGTLWPQREINDNGAGPEYGPRDGLGMIPSMDLPLAYLRGD